MDSGGGQEPSRPLTADEETLKRNTDCVYFLASPLTCKKGSECEYRHSEGARFNPTDCWYWLKGNCLNQKCCFRHPPLDWLLGDHGDGIVPAELLLSSGLSTIVQVAHGPASHYINKQNVPCYFFQKGHCLKGDRCPFIHGQQPDNTTSTQQVSVISASPSDLPSALTRDKWVPKECTHQQGIPRATAAKPVAMLSSSGKPVIQATNGPNNGFAIEQSASPHPLEDEPPMFELNKFPLRSGDPLSHPRSHQSWSIDENLQNGKEADEFLGESSPGFDVLVDDHMEGSDYYQNEDEYAGAPVQGESSLNFMNDFNYHHPDYEPVPRLESDQYKEIGEYDMSRSFHGQDQCRASSFERFLDRPSMLEKRMLREESYHELDHSDLRHRLLKLRRLNGLGLDCNADHDGNDGWRDNRYIHRDRSHARHSQRECQSIPRERYISTRLKGRIALPARSSPDQPIALWSEIDTRREIYQRRLSQASLMNCGRHHEKIKRRLHDDFSSNATKSSRRAIRKDGAHPSDFAGPKSLAELKGVKISERSQEQKSLSSRKVLACWESEALLSFEGPKPLSVILKRKRETAIGNSAISGSGEGNDQRDADGHVRHPASVVSSGSHQYQHSSLAENGGNIPEASKVATVDEEEEEGMATTEGEEVLNNGQSLVKVSTHEVGDEMIGKWYG